MSLADFTAETKEQHDGLTNIQMDEVLRYLIAVRWAVIWKRKRDGEMWIEGVVQWQEVGNESESESGSGSESGRGNGEEEGVEKGEDESDEESDEESDAERSESDDSSA